MVSYVKSHNFDEDETVNIQIFTIFKNHLLKARTEEDGTLVGFDDMEDEMYEGYKEKQSNLNSLGVTDLALVAIATHRAGIEGNLADEALEVLMEITMAGNPAAQKSVADHVQMIDRDGRVWNHLKERMIISKEIIVERNACVTEKFERMDSPVVKEYGNCGQTFNVLQQLTEGHNATNQDLLREQPTHSGEINLITMVCDMLVTQCSNKKLVKAMQREALDLVCDTLDCMVEVLQGPCPGNQELIANHPAMAVISNIIEIVDFPNLQEHELDVIGDVKNKAIMMVASCLEGRKESANDQIVCGKLADTMEAGMLSVVRTITLLCYVSHHLVAESRGLRVEG